MDELSNFPNQKEILELKREHDARHSRLETVAVCLVTSQP